MAYVKSKNIKVYPSAFRGSTTQQNNIQYVFDPESRLSTEENNIRCYNLLADFSSIDPSEFKGRGDFVVTKSWAGSGVFEFVVNGYYFQIKDAAEVFAVPNAGQQYNYFAKINLIYRASNPSEDSENINYVGKTLGYVSDNASDQAANSSNNLDSNTGNTTQFNGLLIEQTQGDAEPSGYSADGTWLKLITIKKANDGTITYTVPESSVVKTDKKSIYGGLSKDNKKIKSLDNLLETKNIGFFESIYSIPKNAGALPNERAKNNIILEGSTGKIRASILTNYPESDVPDSSGNLQRRHGNIVVAAVPSNSDLHENETAESNVFIDAENKIEITATKGLEVKSINENIAVEAKKDITLTASSYVPNMETYTLPLITDNEPDDFSSENPHIIATRNWLNSNITLTGTKTFKTNEFKLTNTSDQERFKFVPTGSYLNISASTVAFYNEPTDSSDAWTLKLYRKGIIESNNADTPFENSSWQTKGALKITNGGAYIKGALRVDSPLRLASNTTINSTNITTSCAVQVTNQTAADASNGALNVSGGIRSGKNIYDADTANAECSWTEDHSYTEPDLSEPLTGSFVTQGGAWVRKDLKISQDGQVYIYNDEAPDPTISVADDNCALTVFGGTRIEGSSYFASTATLNLNQPNDGCALTVAGDLYTKKYVTAGSIRVAPLNTSNALDYGGKIIFGPNNNQGLLDVFIGHGTLSKNDAGSISYTPCSSSTQGNLSIKARNVYVGARYQPDTGSATDGKITLLNETKIESKLTVSGWVGDSHADLGTRIRIPYGKKHSLSIYADTNDGNGEASIRYTTNDTFEQSESQNKSWVVGLGAGTARENFGWYVNGLDNQSGSAAYLTPTGQMNAVSFNATSDRRLKDNIHSYKPKKSILNLDIYKYDLHAGLKNQIGCMAQDLREICPEIVTENSDGYLSIQESKIVYLLLDEIKKLNKKVKKLEKDIKKSEK